MHAYDVWKNTPPAKYFGLAINIATSVVQLILQQFSENRDCQAPCQTPLENETHIISISPLDSQVSHGSYVVFESTVMIAHTTDHESSYLYHSSVRSNCARQENCLEAALSHVIALSPNPCFSGFLNLLTRPISSAPEDRALTVASRGKMG